MISRRTLLTATTIAVLGGSLPHLNLGTVWANTSIKRGNKTVDVLSDGNLVLPANMLFSDIDEADLVPILRRYGVSNKSLEPDCNLTLVRDGKNTIIFDVGAGPNFMPSAGKLTQALEAIELDPSDVTHVVFTHAHPDHLWGLLDEFDELLFPEAQYMMGKTEWDYWINPNTVETIGSERQAFAAGASRLLKIIEDKVELFNFDQEILPGVMSHNSVGHTPGHSAFEVSLGNENLMIVGDAIGNHHVAFEQPKWLAGSDQDKDQGVKSRVALLEQIDSEKMMMIGFHLPYPGIGRAEKIKDGYKFLPA